MNIINLSLIIVATLNFIFSILVLTRNFKSKINLYFFFTMLFSVFWSLCLVGYFFMFSSPVRLVFVKLSYISALYISFYFFLFCYHFPFKKISISKILIFILYLFVILFSFFISINNDFFIYSDQLFVNNIEITRPINYSFYVAIFSLFVLIGFLQLIYKYKDSEGTNKKLIGYVIVGTLLSFLFGFITNLLPAYWNNFEIAWLGPVFTLINLLVIAYLLFIKKFNIIWK